jgi:membrane protease YdiL (CAAX protease family)
MAVGSASRQTHSRRSPGPWPPSAEAQGVELSVVAQVLLVASLTFVAYVLIGAAPRDEGPASYIRWQVASQALELVVWLAIIGALGWWKAAGVVRGSISLWGVVPVIILSAASLLEAGHAEESWVGPGLQAAVAVGVFAGALEEEVVFRGFLYHGLTRRLGGATAVVVGSLLFAVYHIPVMIRRDLSDGAMLALLVNHFAFGMFMCRVRAQTGSVWFLIHTLWNLATVEIAIWAYPEGQYPELLWNLRFAAYGVGLFLGFGLLVRSMIARYVWGPPGKQFVWTEWPFVWSRLLRPPSPKTLERFTDRACCAVVLAQEEARAQGARLVGPEHLLLAITHECDALTTNALATAGVTLGSHTRLDELSTDRAKGAPELAFTQSAKLILRLAAAEASIWNHPHITTEHLVLGLTAPALRRGEAAQVLRQQGVDPAHLRRATISLMVDGT